MAENQKPNQGKPQREQDEKGGMSQPQEKGGEKQDIGREETGQKPGAPEVEPDVSKDEPKEEETKDEDEEMDEEDRITQRNPAQRGDTEKKPL